MKRALWLLGMLALLATVGCDRLAAESAENAQNSENPQKTRRIVTLAPALSRMVVDLGLADEMVGVAEHDDAAPKHLPIVGHFQAIDREKLLGLKPTHVLTNVSDAAALPAALVELADQMGFALASWPYPSDVESALATVEGTADRPGVGQVLGAPAEAEALAERVRAQLDAVRKASAKRGTRPRVLLVFGVSPVMASGPGSVLDDLLTHYVLAENAADHANVSAPTFTRESLMAARPDVIVLLSPDAPPMPDPATDPRAAVFRDLPIPAVEHGRIHVINHPQALLPSTNLGQLAQRLADLVATDE